MGHRPPFRHPKPFRPAQDELDEVRSGTSGRPHWQSIVIIAFFVLLGILVVALHLVGIVGLGLHVGG